MKKHRLPVKSYTTETSFKKYTIDSRSLIDHYAGSLEVPNNLKSVDIEEATKFI